jgi:hypothetical protein
VAAWIAETQAERRLAEQRATATPAKITETGDRLSEDEIVAIVEERGDMVTALRDADRADRSARKSCNRAWRSW